MAKVALIERELKRDKLVAQYAKKYAGSRQLRQCQNRTKNAQHARLVLQNFPQCQPYASA